MKKQSEPRAVATGSGKSTQKKPSRSTRKLKSPSVPFALGLAGAGVIGAALGRTLGSIFPRNDQIKIEIKSEKIKDEITLNLDGVTIALKPMPDED